MQSIFFWINWNYRGCNTNFSFHTCTVCFAMPRKTQCIGSIIWHRTMSKEGVSNSTEYLTPECCVLSTLVYRCVVYWVRWYTGVWCIEYVGILACGVLSMLVYWCVVYWVCWYIGVWMYWVRWYIGVWMYWVCWYIGAWCIEYVGILVRGVLSMLVYLCVVYWVHWYIGVWCIEYVGI